MLMRRWLVALGLTLVNALHASCCPVGSAQWGACELIGQALYMRPSSADLGFDIPSKPFSNDTSQSFIVGQEVGVCPSYSWGFRAGAGTLFNRGCNDVRLVYSYLRTDSRHSERTVDDVDEQGIWLTYGYPLFEQNLIQGALVRQRVRLQWDAVDAEIGQRCKRGSHLTLRSHAGLHYADFFFNREVKVQGQVDDHLNQGVRSFGIGPRIGMDVNYALICGFGVSGHVGAGLLAGEAKDSIRYDFTRSDAIDHVIRVDHRNKHLLFSEFDASLGVRYLLCCCGCLALSTELGYEFRSYLGALPRTTFNDRGATNQEPCEAFSMDGFYLNFILSM